MDRSSLISDLEKQFSENPRRVFARLANEYRKAGDPERSIEMCRAHIPQQPGYISGHIVLGQALFDRGEMDEARQTFETALALDPENLIALRQMGDIARQLGDTSAAQSWYQRLLDVDPQNEEVSAILESMAPSKASGLPTTVATDADLVGGRGQLDPVVSTATKAPGLDAEPARGDSDFTRSLLEPSGELLPASPEGDKAGATAPSDGVAEHEPLDILLPIEDTHSSIAAEAVESASDLGLPRIETESWRLVPREPGFDSEPEFSIDVESQPFEGIGAGNYSAGNDRIVLEDEDALPEVLEDATADAPEVGVTDIGDLLHAESSGAGVPPSETLESSQDARSTAYSYDPHLGRTFGGRATPAEETPAAFVTETMAELYLQQGFRDEALSVYRRLLEQNPADNELHARVAHLERGEVASIAGFSAIGRRAEIQEVETKFSTVRSLLSALAARRPSKESSPRSGEPREADTVQMDEKSPDMSASRGFFGQHDAPEEDENAAERLAHAYSEVNMNAEDETRGQPSRAASRGLSLDDVFRGAEARTEKSNDGSGSSFDDFFADAGENDRASSGGRAADEREAATRPEESDLEAFNAWLEGLKK